MRSCRQAPDLDFREADGYLFVVVESGSLVLTAEHDTPALERLGTGAAAVVLPGAPFALHNLDDDDVVTAILVTVLPGDGTATLLS